MATQSAPHGAVSGRSCFKCRNELGVDSMRYLNHDWCAACARKEAEVRLRLRVSRESGNGSKQAEAPGLPELPSSTQALLQTVPATGRNDIRRMLTLACAIGGPLLLLLGLGVVAADPMTVAGATLTLSGAILISAVVRQGA